MSGGRQWVYHIADPLPESVQEPKQLLGGKGASLQAMSGAGLAVPPAFVISTECCEYFFQHEHTWPQDLERQVREGLKRLEKDTGRQYGKGKRPLLLSVRSGAARSMPGMMDTLLNVGLHPDLAWDLGDGEHFWGVYVEFIVMFAGTTADLGADVLGRIRDLAARGASEETARRALEIYQEHVGQPFPKEPWTLLVECINAVFRSWNNDRAVEYRKRNDIRGLNGTGVTVQAMFPSQVSGILFTQDPNSLTADRMIIEASYGLGEAVVSGDVSPDRFTVSRSDFGDFKTVVGKKAHAVRALGDESEYDPNARCLTAEQVREVCELGLRVEEYFGMPMDIEWGISEGRFALLQSRPIRGLEVVQDAEVAREDEIARLRSIAGDQRRVWAIYNLAETLRYPTPLTWDVIRRFMSGSGGFGRMYQDLGYRPSERVKTEGFLELICGQIYVDPERLAGLFWDCMPMTYDLGETVRDPRVLEKAPAGFDSTRVDGRLLLKLPGVLWAMLRSSRRLKRLRRGAREAFEREALPRYLAYVQEKRAQDLTGLPTEAVLLELDKRCERVLGEFGKESLKPGFVGGLALDELTELLRSLGGEDGAALANTLTMALDGDLSVEQDVLLYHVARGEATMEEFLERFGHRAVGEMELMEPRWREDPGYLEQVVARLGSSGGRNPEEIHGQKVREREAAEKHLPQRLAEWGGSSFQGDIDGLLAQARALLPYRENGKYYLMMGYELIRLAILELSRRWDLGNDVFHLRRDELVGFEEDREHLLKVVGDRKVRWQSCQRLEMPDVIDSRDLDDLGLPREAEGPAHRLDGDPVAAGVATGTARIVFDPRQAGDIGVDYVLVCPSTDPGWTSLFVNARGLVVERGGILSHGAIVARDFGIPAVVCPGATGRIHEGATIRVDGNQGRITVLEEG